MDSLVFSLEVSVAQNLPWSNHHRFLESISLKHILVKQSKHSLISLRTKYEKQYSNFGIIYPFRLKKHWYTKNRSKSRSSQLQVEKRSCLGTIRTKWNMSTSYLICKQIHFIHSNSYNKRNQLWNTTFPPYANFELRHGRRFALGISANISYSNKIWNMQLYWVYNQYVVSGPAVNFCNQN